MTKDMTTGNPLRLIWQFSVPLVFGNLFQQLYNLVDTIIVGRYLGLLSLTAVGATNSIMFLIIGFCSGTCTGIGVPVAQRFGAKDYSEMHKYVMNAVYLCLIIAAGLTVATCLLCDDILTWMGTPADIFDQSYSYLFIIFLGLPFTILYNATASIIRALGDSKTPFYFLVLSTVLNIVLDLIFIISFQMGVAGAAVATITAQAVSGVLCLIYMVKKYDILKSNREERRFRAGYIGTLVKMGVPMGLQFSITAIGSIILQSAVNMLGTVYVSAYTSALKVQQLAMCPFDAFATAGSTFSGQNLGARQFKRIRQGVLCSVGIALVYSVGIGLVLIFAGSKIALLFVSAAETEVLGYVQQLLTVSGIFFWLLAILNCTRMAIQGLGYSAAAMLAGCSELVARGLVALVFIPMRGYHAVCYTSPLAWTFAVCVVVPMFLIVVRRLERKYMV
ncbi:MAG: MATE family efflux transporter [Clostridiales bacterium]|nr:MATE family efflux transporter [Clostridiales bacterium]